MLKRFYSVAMSSNETISFVALSNTSQIDYKKSESSTSRTIDTETVITACFYAIIAISAVCGNLLVMIAVKTTHSLQFTSNFLLANLALADFLQGAVSLPLRLYELLSPCLDLITFCPVAIPCSILFGGTSNLNILFISIERFIAIRWPYMYYTHVTTKSVVAVILFSWISVGVLALLPALGWGRVLPNPVLVQSCRFPSFLTGEYITALYVFVHVIPIVTVIFLYGFLLRVSCFHARKIHAQEVRAQVKYSSSCNLQSVTASDAQNSTNEENPLPRRGQTARQMKALKTVSVVVGVFIVLVVPIIAIDVVEMLGSPKAPNVLIKITVCMIYANQGVNALIYAGFNNDYRKAFKKIISNKVSCVTSTILRFN